MTKAGSIKAVKSTATAVQSLILATQALVNIQEYNKADRIVTFLDSLQDSLQSLKKENFKVCQSCNTKSEQCSQCDSSFNLFENDWYQACKTRKCTYCGTMVTYEDTNHDWYHKCQHCKDDREEWENDQKLAQWTDNKPCITCTEIEDKENCPNKETCNAMIEWLAEAPSN